MAEEQSGTGFWAISILKQLYIMIMKSTCIRVVIFFILSINLFSYAGTLDDIRRKLNVSPTPSRGGEKEGARGDIKEAKGFKQVNGKYYIVQVKDISVEEAEKILQHMDRLMEEFLKLYEYPFGTQRCYVIVYGLKKDFERVARVEDLENPRAFSYRKGINHYAVTYYEADLYQTLNHEAFHLFIENIFKKDVPIWFNEGMACYYETCEFVGSRFEANRVNKARLSTAKDSIRTKQWPSPRDLVRFSWGEFHGANECINYAASWALIYYLKNKDEGAFKNFVSDLVLGKSFSTCIRQNYNMDLKQLEDEWLKYIERL